MTCRDASCGVAPAAMAAENAPPALATSAAISSSENNRNSGTAPPAPR
jgi:hypothetical protein